jgi:hypothetical protein
VLYRFRSQARPETFVAILLAAQLWLLERRRAAEASRSGLDPAWGVVPLAMLWANAHISFLVGLMLTGIHLLAAIAPRTARRPPAPRTLLLVLLASVAASFLNPFGWRALAQPIEYFLVWRHEPIYQVIGELRPIDWSQHLGAMLPFWFAAVGLLALARWIRHEFDVVQCLVLLVFVPQAVTTQRFLGTLAVLVAPYFARDLDWAATTVRLPRRVRAPAIGLALLGVAAVAERAPEMRLGLGFRWSEFPVRACDWIESHGVRGRGFNSFGDAGYLLWRFWPDRGRLPFMDIHQSGTRRDRDLTAFALSDESAWRRLDDERRFDYVLLPSRQFEGQRILDFLDADSLTWRLVFLDDAAALYLRREGPFADIAERERYRVLPAGDAAVAALAARPVADTAFSAELRRELERCVQASPWTSVAHNMLAQLARAEGRFEEAAREDGAAKAAASARPATAPRSSP